MGYPVFASGDVLNASDMNAVGMWLVKTQTVGTGVSSVTVTGAFSADYDNYRIVWSGSSASVVDTVSLFQFGSTTSNYNSVMRLYKLGTGDITLPQTSAANFYCSVQQASNTAVSLDVFQPYASQNTVWTGSSFGYLSQFTFAGVLQNTTQYTSFTITPNAGTLTGGTIRVYGYRN